MSRKLKFSKEIIFTTVEQYNKGIKSMAQLSEELDLSISTISDWVRNYESIGIKSFEAFDSYRIKETKDWLAN